jgi:hypothetical protein
VIAALFVESKGCYQGLPNVDPWDIKRNAMLYDGPHPVIAHPPCARWSMLAGLVEARYGHKKGDDGGTFAFALEAVRKWGGVLEHPAYSAAWSAFDLPRPHADGGWQRGFCGGWSCHVEQSQYGHRAHKATWLYAYGCEPPSLKWGVGEATARASEAHGNERRLVERMGHAERLATPLTFRDMLIAMAESASGSSSRPQRPPAPEPTPPETASRSRQTI